VARASRPWGQRASRLLILRHESFSFSRDRRDARRPHGRDARATAKGAKLRVNVDLQRDFALNQTLALYLVDTLPLIDPAAPDYALVVLTLVESILEDPDVILRRQLNKVKGQAIAEMKMEGLDYNQRMEELEKLEYPKPNRDFIYSTFNAFAAQHPWVGQENIRPKSIAREMFEEFRSFADYIKIYELARSEGVLLRHLSSVHKVLAQTVPDSAKNETLREMELYLSTMLRQIDSSLLEEWEKMRDPSYQAPGDNGTIRERSKLYRPGDIKVTALHNVSLRIAAGEFLALMGPSGSGKSTLLHIIAGIDRPTSGDCVVQNVRVTELDESALADWRNQNVGFVFQTFNLIPVLTAAENVELPLLLMDIPSRRRRELALNALELVGLADRSTHLPRQLSGGQEQRVAIARALVTDPKLIVADEPTGNLDHQSAEDVLGILQTLSQKAGRTVIMVTHDPRAAAYGSRSIHLEKGELQP
jgi:ABC-type lipoprotein export system ATPase subunit